jgi:hypothetical protein
MFILDSLLVSGLRWVLDTVATATDAEMNDDTALREELLAAELRREMGEISDDEFADIEANLLARIREIKERREGTGPIAFGADEGSPGDSALQVEATVSGDFHEPRSTDSGTVIEGTLIDHGAAAASGSSRRSRSTGATRRSRPSRSSRASTKRGRS